MTSQILYGLTSVLLSGLAIGCAAHRYRQQPAGQPKPPVKPADLQRRMLEWNLVSSGRGYKIRWVRDGGVIGEPDPEDLFTLKSAQVDDRDQLSKWIAEVNRAVVEERAKQAARLQKLLRETPPGKRGDPLSRWFSIDDTGVRPFPGEPEGFLGGRGPLVQLPLPLSTPKQRTKGRRADLSDAEIDRAWVEVNQGKFREGRSRVEAILSRQPGHEKALMVLVLSFAGEGNFGMAQLRLENFKGLAPESPYYFWAEGLTHFLRGDFVRALPSIRRVAEKIPDDFTIMKMTAVILANIEQKSKGLEALAGYLPKNAREKAAVGLLRHGMGEKKEGLLQLREAAREEPQNPDILGNLAVVLFFSNTDDSLSDAKSLAAEALRIRPDQLQAMAVHLFLQYKTLPKDQLAGLIPHFEELDRRLEAIIGSDRRSPWQLAIGEQFDTTLHYSTFPAPAEIRSRLALCYLYSDLPEKAEPLLEQGWQEEWWEISSFLSQRDYPRLLAVSESRQNKVKEAESHLRQGLVRWPDEPRYLAEYLNILIGANRLDEGRPVYERLRKILDTSKPSIPFPYKVAAGFLNATGDLNGTETVLRQLLDLQPREAEAYTALAFTLENQGRFAESVKTAERALELGDSTPLPYHILVTAAIASQNWREVDRWMMELTRRFPNETDFAENVSFHYLELVGKTITHRGLLPIPPGSREEEWLHGVSRWNEQLISLNPQGQGARYLFLLAQSILGRAAIDHLDQYSPDTVYPTVELVIRAQNGREEEAMRLIPKIMIMAASELGKISVSVDMFYPLTLKGATKTALALFDALWKAPDRNRKDLIEVVRAITNHPFSPEAAPFVTAVAERVADHYYYQNRPRDAAHFYRKSIEADRTRETAWIGLMRSLKLSAASRELQVTEEEYRRQFPPHFGSP